MSNGQLARIRETLRLVDKNEGMPTRRELYAQQFDYDLWAIHRKLKAQEVMGGQSLSPFRPDDGNLSSRPRRKMSIRRRGQPRLCRCETACRLVLHQREPCPWLGLLLIQNYHEGQCVGIEVARPIEETSTSYDQSVVLLSTLQANPDARCFWERLGYAVFD